MKELSQVGNMSPAQRRAFAIANSDRWEKEAVEKADEREAKAAKVKASVDVSQPGVELVNGAQWQELREENKYNLLVTFYLPDCPYCKQFVTGENAPYDGMSNKLDQMDIGVKAVKMDIDATDEPILLDSVPAVYLFTKEGLALPFEGNYMDSNALTDWVTKEVSPKTALIETPSADVQHQNSDAQAHHVCKVKHDIDTLNALQWSQLYSAKEQDYLMVFYAPWCPYSNSFALAKHAPLKALKENLAKVHGPKVVQFDVYNNRPPVVVKHVPSVVLFRKTGEVMEYEGTPRNVQGLMTWALDSASSPKEVGVAKEAKPHFLETKPIR